MKLFTHNLLCCPKCASFPLQITNIQETELANQGVAPNIILLKNIYQRLNFNALQDAARAVGIEGVPEQFPEEFPLKIPGPNEIIAAADPSSEAFVRALSTLLFDVELVKCDLVCDHCKREYHVTDKVPNLVLNEVEIEEKGKYTKERGTKQFIVHESSNQHLEQDQKEEDQPEDDEIMT